MDFYVVFYRGLENVLKMVYILKFHRVLPTRVASHGDETQKKCENETFPSNS